ncbi:uncharacterized protein LOC112687852 isoform X2 [Sipha flava]|uniref:Uncharacterized protein LOC112687852 isoform X2 n=1 Tax=Sipha flava TaxID=143950 RepID=A0A8B8G1R2_9HEMI|nr:uncharacterized protein LOC112687852 isoform X2 [Sipha flava]
MINNENVIPCFINMPSLYGDVLCLKELLRADSIVNAVSFQTNSNNIFALVLSNDLILYCDHAPPLLKWLPWPKDDRKRIVSLAFKSTSEKLLVCGFDCTLYLVFVREIFEPREGDRRNKVKIIRPAPGEPTSSLNPTAITWWTPIVPTYSSDIGIVGGNIGEIVFVNLRTGACLGSTCVKFSIKFLEILNESGSNTIWLIIISTNGDRSKLLLENLDIGYCWLNPKTHSAHDKTAKPTNSLNIENIVPVISNFPSTRARLLGLRQLFIEKLSAPKKQRSVVNCVQSVPNDVRHPKRSFSSDTITSGCSCPSTGPLPEPMPTVVDMKSSVQSHRGKQTIVSSCSNHILVHASGFNTNQPLIYKLFKGEEIENFLYTDQFIFISQNGGTKLNVYSSNLCQLKSDVDDDKEKSLFDTFNFDNGEIILNIFRVLGRKVKENVDISLSVSPKNKNRTASSKKKKYDRQHSRKDNSISELCAIVTNCRLYFLHLSIKPEEIIFKNIMDGALDHANNLSEIFDIDIRPILERAADQQLSARKFEDATLLYRLSKTNPLKRVLRLASSGNTDKVVLFVSTLLEQAHPRDLTPLERLHISNLAVMSYTEQLLRATSRDKSRLESKFLRLLSENNHYDEVLCVNIVGQSRLCNVLRFLAVERGLHNEVITVLVSLMSQQSTDSRYLHSTEGFWDLVSESIFTEVLVACNKFTTLHSKFVQANLKNVSNDILLKLKILYDPSNPALRPILRKVFQFKNETESITEQDNNLNYSIKEWLTTYLMIISRLSSNQYSDNLIESVTFSHQLISNTSNSENEIDHKSSLGAGWAHAAHIRNHKLYTWGHSSCGCLGVGPHMTKTSTPNPVSWFVYIRVEVIQVACGRNHSIALTTNGVYSWGSNRYGQLGTGRRGQAPYPMLVKSLSDELLVSVSAGQYHSLAISTRGKLWTWGWGVYGQLGHGAIDDCEKPKLLKSLESENIISAYGGYSHSIILTSKGKVFTFGSGSFGQLGNGSTTKITSPVPVYGLPEPIRCIYTAYFHNLALSDVGRLYTWGSSPQVLRFHAQTQKRARNQLALNEGDHMDAEIDALTADDGLLHLSPTLVDTSHILGEIVQMCCGCHHSAVINSTGQLYTWGLNLDGQLGVSGVRERLVPTVTLVGPPSVADPSSTNGSLIKEVRCGADFTLALDASNKLWGWGSNHEGQLGKIPEEDLAKTLLDGKMVMIKSTHKVIKIQHGTVNKLDSPIEIILPQLRFSFSNIKDILSIQVKRLLSFPGLCPFERFLENLNNIFNVHGVDYLLHYAAEWFYPYYNISSVVSMCLEMKNHQAISKIRLINNEPSLALFHQHEAFVETRDYGEMFGFNVEGGHEEPAPALTPCEGFSINLEEGELFTSLPESFASRVVTEETIVKEWPGISKLAQMFEYYFKFIPKDNLVSFLHEYLTYWLTKSFPVDALEQLLLDRWDKLNHPLGILLLCNSGSSKAHDLDELDMKIMEPKTIIRCFSVNFCLQLCTSVSKNIENKSENQKDFIQLLATVTNSPGSGWIEPLSETKSEDLLKCSVQTLNTNQFQPFMHLEFQDTETLGDTLLVYSCGHRYSSNEQFNEDTKMVVDHLDHLPNTAAAVQTTLQDTSNSACPNCVYEQMNNLIQRN